MQGYRVVRAIMSAVLLMSLTACFTLKRHGELPTAENVNLQRILGTWYVQGAMTTVLDREPVDATFTFSQNRRGEIRLEYAFRPKTADAPLKVYSAKVEPGDSGADWDIQFVWPFENDYKVLYVDPEYTSMIVGHPTRKYLYILSRQEEILPSRMEWLLDFAASRGFDVSFLKRVPQP